MWVYMLKNKSDAFDAFKKLKVKVEKGKKRELKLLKLTEDGNSCQRNLLLIARSKELLDILLHRTRHNKTACSKGEIEQ